MKGLKKVIKGLKKGAPPPAEAREGWGGNGTKDDVGKLALHLAGIGLGVLRLVEAERAERSVRVEDVQLILRPGLVDGGREGLVRLHVTTRRQERQSAISVCRSADGSAEPTREPGWATAAQAGSARLPFSGRLPEP
eukprot:scaffold5697_cov102-Isochrysis_galbana.AAC.6